MQFNHDKHPLHYVVSPDWLTYELLSCGDISCSMHTTGFCREKNSPKNLMLPYFLSELISCEADHSDTMTLCTLEWIDYSLAAKFSLFHQQILLGFEMTSSTPDHFSVFAIKRSCYLKLLPTLGVWRAARYGLV